MTNLGGLYQPARRGVPELIHEISGEQPAGAERCEPARVARKQQRRGACGAHVEIGVEHRVDRVPTKCHRVAVGQETSSVVLLGIPREPLVEPSIPGLATPLWTVGVISTMTTVLPSISETPPNVAVSSGYSRASNTVAIESSAVWLSCGDGASVST